MSDSKKDRANDYGYRTVTLGKFSFERDEYFAHITWPDGSHTISVDRFLRALMRDVAWNFFYGTVNFDEVFGTTNHYGTVDVFAGLYNAGYRANNKQFSETLNGEAVRAKFAAMLEDWTNEAFDPFAAPRKPARRSDPSVVAISRRCEGIASWRGGWWDSGAIHRFALTRAAILLTDSLAMSIRTSLKFTPSRASRTKCTRSTSLHISPAQT